MTKSGKTTMGRPSDKLINRFIADWMIANRHPTVNNAAVERSIRQKTLETLADLEVPHKFFAQILELAEKMELEPGELMRGVIEGLDRKPLSRQQIIDIVNGDQIAS